MKELLGLIAFVGFVILAVLGFPAFARWADRRRVRRKIESLGGEVIEIERGIPASWSELLGRGITTGWRVRYRDKDGQEHVASVTATAFLIVVKEDKPHEP